MKLSLLTADGLNAMTNYMRFLLFQSRWLAIFIPISLLLACATKEPVLAPPPEPVAEEEPQPPEPVRLAPRAPERYVVKRGDTLWDISTMFLEDPWLWPEIWHVNPQIQNPHLIYPGDIITIFYVDGQAHLRLERDGRVYQTTLRVERLSPQVRITKLEDAIPVIPIDAIRAFLSRPHILDKKTIRAAPYIMRSVDERLLSTAGDRVYVRGVDQVVGAQYSILQLGETYVDPDTKDDIGREAIYVGDGTILETGDPATMRINNSSREALAGNLLFKSAADEFDENILPKIPNRDIDGKIISVVDGVSQIGQYQIVVINQGLRDGLDIGHVLDIYQLSGTYVDEFARKQGKRRGSRKSRRVQLPEQRAGTMLVFRPMERVSYGLVLRANKAMHIGDVVRTPR